MTMDHGDLCEGAGSTTRVNIRRDRELKRVTSREHVHFLNRANISGQPSLNKSGNDEK